MLGEEEANAAAKMAAAAAALADPVDSSVAEPALDTVDMECEEEEKEVEQPSMLHELYKDDPTVAGGSRHLRCKILHFLRPL